jgi:hypothetical protein
MKKSKYGAFITVTIFLGLSIVKTQIGIPNLSKRYEEDNTHISSASDDGRMSSYKRRA